MLFYESKLSIRYFLEISGKWLECTRKINNWSISVYVYNSSSLKKILWLPRVFLRIMLLTKSFRFSLQCFGNNRRRIWGRTGRMWQHCFDKWYDHLSIFLYALTWMPLFIKSLTKIDIRLFRPFSLLGENSTSRKVPVQNFTRILTKLCWKWKKNSFRHVKTDIIKH